MRIGSPKKLLSQNAETALWEALHVEGDQAARALLIERYYPLAKQSAALVYSRRVMDDIDFEDYLHFAVVGLIECIDRFDATRGVPFEAFSLKRMKGAVFNGIEKYTELREQVGHRARIRRERLKSITDDTQDQPNDHDLFSSLADVVVNLALGYFLEDSDLHNNSNLHSGDQMLELVGLEQLRRQIATVVESLPERERVVIQYHYYHQMAFSDIADVLDVTKGRVSQLHKRALNKVRESLQSLLSVNETY